MKVMKALMKSRKSRKAQVPEAVLILAVMIICVQTIYSTAIFKAEIAKALGPPKEVMDFYRNIDSLEISIKEAGRLSINKGFSEALAKPANCKIIFSEQKQVAVWTEICGPANNKLKEDLLGETSKSFSNMTGKKKFIIEYKDDRMSFTPSDIQSSVYVIGDFSIYNITYRFGSPFELSYPTADVGRIYSDSIAKKKSCERDKRELETCMGSMQFPGWKSSSKTEGNYLLFTLKSEKNYPYDGGFKPVEIRFAIQKLS